MYNVMFIITFDYDKHYNELLKNALKYGMNSREFWYDNDYKDYFLYEEAYFEKLHEQTHIQGYYNYIAFNTVLSNAFMDKNKGQKPVEYPKENIYITSMEKSDIKQNNNVKSNVKLTKENLQKVYMSRLANCY